MIHDFKVRKRASQRIEIFVDKIEQLFNSMDPSPFHEKDLAGVRRPLVPLLMLEPAIRTPFR